MNKKLEQLVQVCIPGYDFKNKTTETILNDLATIADKTYILHQYTSNKKFTNKNLTTVSVYELCKYIMVVIDRPLAIQNIIITPAIIYENQSLKNICKVALTAFEK